MEARWTLEETEMGAACIEKEMRQGLRWRRCRRGFEMGHFFFFFRYTWGFCVKDLQLISHLSLHLLQMSHSLCGRKEFQVSCKTTWVHGDQRRILWQKDLILAKGISIISTQPWIYGTQILKISLVTLLMRFSIIRISIKLGWVLLIHWALASMRGLNWSWRVPTATAISGKKSSITKPMY